MIRVLVFPSSNEPGLEIVRSLIDQPGVEVHGGSCFEANEDASASLLKHHTRFPELGTHAFRSTIEDYIRRERIDIVFPSIETMVSQFSTWKMDGVQFISQSPEVAATVESKQATYAALDGEVPVPEIYTSEVPCYPAYAKPRAGSGGRGHLLVTNAEDLHLARERGLLVTEYLPGGEIVAYGLGDPQGRQILCITKTMGRWRGGASQLGCLTDDPVVRGHAATIARLLKLAGPWFAQFKQDRHGNYKLMEVNARPGGAIGICRYAGVNIPLLAVRLFAGQSVEVMRHTETLSWVRNLRPFITTSSFDHVIWSLGSLVRPADTKLRPQAVAALFDLSNRGIRQECYGEDTPGSVERWNLSAHFTRRHTTLSDTYDSVTDPATTIFVTDDLSEQRSISDALPAARVLSAGTLDALGQERL